MTDNMEISYIRTFEEIEGIRPIWEHLQAKENFPKINADIDRYLSIIKTVREEIQPYILLVKQNDVVVGMLIGHIYRNPIKCNLGRKTIFKPYLKILSVVYGGILGNLSKDTCDLLMGELTTLLRNDELDAVYFNHLETDSFFYKYIRKKTNALCRSHFPKIEYHVAISAPQDTEYLLKCCSKNRRKHIRKYIKRLEKEYPGKVKLSVYTKEKEVDLAIETIANISSQTYQWAFGGGLVNDEKTRIIWHSAAKKGWLRVYILNVNNEPCAFRYALKYRRTYFGELIGYLPKWKDFNVGTVLFMKFIEQICHEPDVERIDFGFGGGYHKELGNSYCWPEASLYIYAPKVFPIMVNIIQSTTSAISISTEHLVNKLGVFNAVQKYRRKKVIQKNP